LIWVKPGAVPSPARLAIMGRDDFLFLVSILWTGAAAGAFLLVFFVL